MNVLNLLKLTLSTPVWMVDTMDGKQQQGIIKPEYYLIFRKIYEKYILLVSNESQIYNF